MKRFLLSVAILAVVAAALVAALGPTALGQYRLWRFARVASGYRDVADALDPMDCDLMATAAQRYNAALGEPALTDAFGGAAEATAGYRELLNPGGDGVMAVLELAKLGATMPVYHGTDDAVLEAGVGHLEGSSLPVGGSGARSVFAGRRGGFIPGPFANLDRLIPGDWFAVRTLREEQIYEVYRVDTLSPEAIGGAPPEAGSEECVLMTTAPYGEDSQRLLVYGKRVSRRAAPMEEYTRELPGWAARTALAAPVALAGWLLVALAALLARIGRRRRLRRMKL